MTLGELLAKFPDARKVADGWTAKCPSHPDANPSLSVTAKDGRVLVHCHAGCPTENVVAALGLKMGDLFANGNGVKPAREIESTYDYTDESGDLLFQSVRYKPKNFAFRRPNGSGGWAYNLNDVRRVLYRLREVLAARDLVFVVEGEKDCETARALGLTATCNPGGAGKWRDEFSVFLLDKFVCIVADADATGRKHAQQVAVSLTGKAAALKVIEMSGAKDLSEFVENGGTREVLMEQIGNAPGWEPQPEPQVSVSAPTVEVEIENVAVGDMPESVFFGRLGQLCQSEMHNFPRAYAWPALVTAAGTLIKGQTVLRRNLFTVIVGPAGTGKSQANEQAMRCLGMDPNGVSPPVLRLKAGSGEGLLKAIGDIGGAPRLYAVDELGHLLEKSALQHSSFAHILNGLFYGERQHLRIARGEEVNFNCSLSILGGLLEETFGDLFGKATTGGLYDRFAFGQVPSGYSYSYRPFEGHAIDVQPVAVTVAPSVWDERDSWVKNIPGVSGRIAEIALRFAGICAAFDGKNTLTASDLGPARAFAEYQAKVRMLLRPNPGENFEARAAFKFLSYLQRHAAEGQWVKKRDLLRNARMYELGPSIVDRALAILTFNGDVEVRQAGRESQLRLVP